MENEVYRVLEEKGEGATSYVFEVEEQNTQKIYAAKIYKESNNCYYNEKEILKYVKQKNSPYIINLINDDDNEKIIIIRDNEQFQAKPYLILEYAPKGDLFSYIYFSKTGFGEEYGKLLFYKILKGVQACHEENICHRDLKVQNILVDENNKNWNPKICDFGFAAFNKEQLKKKCGTFNYMAPEIFEEEQPYDGIKADIFSLGVVLFKLVTGKYGFQYEKEKKKYETLYDLIKIGYTDCYWTLLDGWRKIQNLSEDFKNLYIKMVSSDYQKRPSIQDILNDNWLKDIRDLKEDELAKLEESLREEFEKREKIIKDAKTKNVTTVKIDNKNNNNEGNRSSDDEKEYFASDIKPAEVKHGIYIDTYIKINGFLNPNIFMNKLVNRIDDDLGDNCSIDCGKDSLKFDITFEEEEQEQEKIEIPKDIEEKLAKLDLGKDIEKDVEKDTDIDDYNNEQCIIEVQLFKSTDNSHLLRFAKKSGQLDEFYKNMKIISKIAEDLL